MIRSMTGYGRAERRSGPFTVGVEIRSVNHRFAEVRVKLPPELASLEEPLRRKLAAAVSRGKVDATLSVSGLDLPAPVVVNHALVAAYIKAASEVAARHGLGGAVSLESVLALPGAVTLRTADGALDPEQRAAVEAAFDAAVAELQRSRAREGRRLASDLTRRMRAIRRHRAAVARRAKGLPARCAKRLAARLEEIEGGRAVEPQRLAQEVAILAGRSDITEELVRLEGHVEESLRLLREAGEPVGKKLDFLLQEMHREANTINSKSEDLDISRRALAVKAEIEKVREQIQNIE